MATALSADDDLKSGADHIEIEDYGKQVNDIIVKPESLRHLSADELKNLETKMVRKIDMVIMPIMAVLYILNCQCFAIHFLCLSEEKTHVTF
jgi:hypothetical protein